MCCKDHLEHLTDEDHLAHSDGPLFVSIKDRTRERESAHSCVCVCMCVPVCVRACLQIQRYTVK